MSTDSGLGNAPPHELRVRTRASTRSKIIIQLFFTSIGVAIFCVGYWLFVADPDSIVLVFGLIAVFCTIPLGFASTASCNKDERDSAAAAVAAAKAVSPE